MSETPIRYDRAPLEESPPTVTVISPTTPKTSGMAITSMVLGFIGVVSGGLCGCFPISIIAIVLGHISFSKINQQPQLLTGKGIAITGFTAGYVGLVICAISMTICAALGGLATPFLKMLP